MDGTGDATGEPRADVGADVGADVAADVAAGGRSFAERVPLLDGPAATRELYDAWAPTYDDDHDPSVYLLPALVAERVAALVRPGTDVLDAACGTGLVGTALTERGFTSVDGLDLSPRMVTRARRRRRYHDVGPADLSLRLPGAGDKFGVATCVGALAPGQVPLCALAELARVVRPGGLVLATLVDDDLPGLASCLTELAGHGVARLVESTEHASRTDVDAPVRLLVLEVLASPDAV